MRKQGWGEGGRGPPLVTSPPHHQGLIVVCDSRALGPTQALEQKNGLGPVTPFTSAHLPGSPQIHAGEIRLCRRTLNSENGGLVFSQRAEKLALHVVSLPPPVSPVLTPLDLSLFLPSSGSVPGLVTAICLSSPPYFSNTSF